MLIDSHCHLNMLAQKYLLEEILNRAKEAGVGYMQTICTTLEEFPEILNISENYSNVFSSVGIHPNEVKEDILAGTLIELASHPKVIGIGETGLDYYYTPESRLLQIKAFREHIITSQETGLPIIVHTREAEKDTIEIISEEMKNKPFKGVIHCFTGSKELAKSMLDLGLYISISGIVTFKNAQSLKEIVKYIPLDHLLIETDAPYLSPLPFRGKTNEPAFVKYVADYIAELKVIEALELAEATSNNFFKLFSKAKSFIDFPIAADK